MSNFVLIVLCLPLIGQVIANSVTARDIAYETVWDRPAEDEEFLLGQVADAAWDADGNVCIVDFLQKNLVVFDGNGNWLRTLGREGDGPGEVRDARHLFFDGDRYGLLQGIPATIVWFNADGTPSAKVGIGDHDPDSQVFVTASFAVQAGGAIYAWLRRAVAVGEGVDWESWIGTVGSDGSLGPIIYTEPDSPSARVDDGIDEGKVYDIWLRRWVPDGRGGVWVAPERDRYVLQRWTAASEMDLEVIRPYEPVRRNDLGQKNIRVWFRRRGWTNDQIHVGKTAPVVNRLRLSDEGNLWVRLDQGGNDTDSGVLGVYDVFNPAGDYIEQLRFLYRQDVIAWYLLDDAAALIMHTDPDDDVPMLTLVRVADESR